MVPSQACKSTFLILKYLRIGFSKNRFHIQHHKNMLIFSSTLKSWKIPTFFLRWNHIVPSWNYTVPSWNYIVLTWNYMVPFEFTSTVILIRFMMKGMIFYLNYICSGTWLLIVWTDFLCLLRLLCSVAWKPHIEQGCLTPSWTDLLCFLRWLCLVAW